ncbi:MAG: FAD-binding oxidoreductase [Gammaproteobacteria bacterium]|nr:FAD-binding oxidoreductase [Gammaproteobacteria bacterium]
MNSRDELLAKIAAVVGPTGVLTGEDVASRQVGWLNPAPCKAGAIIRPASTEEVSRVMALCHEAGQGVIPVGGNTGLVEGTLAGSDDIMISTERMTAIEATDIDGATMTVQAGVPLEVVQTRAAEQGFMFPVDFGARGSAAIGGAISTNAGGNSVIRYGMMREQVLGLEAVLADGTVVSSMNRMLKNNAGYDLKQLFIGSEGTLGIITRAVLRLRPALKSQNTAFVALESFEKVPALLRHLGSVLGGALSAFEVLWEDFYRTIVVDLDNHQPPVSEGYPFYVLIEARGGDQRADAERFEAALGSALEGELICDAAIAQGGAQRQALWAIRDDIETLIKSLGMPIAFDVSLPIAVADEYVNRVRTRLAERWPDSFRNVTFGHLGDSNIHFIMTIGSTDQDQRAAAMNIVYEELEPYDGSVSAEHGIGLEKRSYLHHSRNAAELALMRTLKQSLDPDNILNPGKVLA